MADTFDSEYKKLNKEQREAVEAISGPVMVVAGPGTGKTQILALRIANILKKTDIKGDGILCLTFTNSAVGAMRERLVRYIGEAGEKVNIFTFHSFGLEIIEKYFSVLGLEENPTLLDETETAEFFDEILNGNEWGYLRPRSDNARYYSDLKSLISLLKRERIGAEEFAEAVEREINFVKNSEENISTRGASKGSLKKEALERIENLEKSAEVVKFLEVYEAAKREKNMIDYDDVLENLVRIVETSKEALADIRERYLYLLVDEHQDSSRVQNEFLAKVWGGLESPDIFVVGDDRQLIYGFSGASIEHFKGFKKTFPGALLIPLVENYRSTQVILDAAHALLPSVMSEEKLVSQSTEHHRIRLVEAPTPEAEILAAAKDIKTKISTGIRPEDCAILVPQNSQARRAMEVLHREGVPVAISESLDFFEQKEGAAFLRILKILATADAPSLAASFFDEVSGVSALEAHEFLSTQNMRAFSFESLAEKGPSLFDGGSPQKWLAKLGEWKRAAETTDLKSLIETIGKELPGQGIVPGQELANTLTKVLEKKPGATLRQFVSKLEKIAEYGERLPLSGVGKSGVKVLTMHSSKGLEFEYVWIAHMDERSLSGGKRWGLALPERINEKIEERDIDAVKRKLFVAITRAKRFCTLSYALSSHKGREQELAKIISELPEEVFAKESAVAAGKQARERGELTQLADKVAERYKEKYVSAWLLNNFFECPWKWYFQSFLGLPEPKAETLLFGGAVHEAVNAVLTQEGARDKESLLKIATEAAEKTGADERMRARIAKDIYKILSAWVENRLPKITPGFKTEEPVSMNDSDFPGLKFFGRIDLIEKISGNEVRVTDFKTGSGRKKSDIEKLDEEGRMGGNLRQLAMYSYLLQNNSKWRADVRESRLEFLEARDPKNAIYDRVITPKEIEMLKADISDYDKLVKTGEWVERECNYNSYGKNTECPYCKMSEVFQ